MNFREWHGKKKRISWSLHCVTPQSLFGGWHTKKTVELGEGVEKFSQGWENPKLGTESGNVNLLGLKNQKSLEVILSKVRKYWSLYKSNAAFHFFYHFSVYFFIPKQKNPFSMISGFYLGGWGFLKVVRECQVERWGWNPLAQVYIQLSDGLSLKHLRVYFLLTLNATSISFDVIFFIAIHNRKKA